MNNLNGRDKVRFRLTHSEFYDVYCDGQSDRVMADPPAIPYAKNPRTHSDSQVAQIAASIVEFGFNNPVLVDTKAGIIAGHGRLLAARKLKLKHVPVVVLDHLRKPRSAPTSSPTIGSPNSRAGTTSYSAASWLNSATPISTSR